MTVVENENGSKMFIYETIAEIIEVMFNVQGEITR